MSDYSYVFNAHPSYIDEMYQKYKNDPSQVEDGWRSFFQGFDFGETSSNGAASGSTTIDLDTIQKEFKVMSIIHGYRDRGHLLSTTNPIKDRKDRAPHLTLADYGLSEADKNTVFKSGEEIGLKNATLNQILDKLNKTYLGNIGFEYAHIENHDKRYWLREKIEASAPADDFDLSMEEKKRILTKLNGAVGFENFLHKKYVGQKRFSLEGGESTIAALDFMISTGGKMDVEEVVIGMAHRGRLNVLANTMGKTYEEIFNEFEGVSVPDHQFGDGDVKYHLGYSSEVETMYGDKVYLKLAPNPSHLEAVNTVVQGFARAKADILYGSDYDKILPVLIHGDAAVAGQGISYETVQMSQLEGYYTGGTIHFVINNQIGFTTDFEDARSSTYCTAAASLVQAPVFHVNGDDPEAVVFAVKLAVEYRQKFNNDVFIDMVCYRKHGHNEGDDPKFTQAKMYDLISKHKNPRVLYAEILNSRGDLEKGMVDKLEKEFWDDLQARFDSVKQNHLPYKLQKPEIAWSKLKTTADPKDFLESPVTGIDAETRDLIINHLMNMPKGFTPISKVKRLLKGKQAYLDAGNLDWAMAELLAYSSILIEGKDVRMSGQDVKRGTFSHRHAFLYDANTFEPLNRLDNIKDGQGKFRIFNSLLSEFGVLGFEFGYSLASPHSLEIWEAQFGDFANGAQTMIDQFISASESKWNRMSGLVMLLPHGYEGQGPEHSSARLERFLQLCGDYNMTVANLTTPANFFHVIRRQLKRDFRKPLIIMSPKSMLRHPKCVSTLDEFTIDNENNKFQEVIDDVSIKDASKVKKALFCTGKVYYDLLAKQEELNTQEVAIVRLEQMYPYPDQKVNALRAKYSNAQFYWVQEEPFNMGAWQYIFSQYQDEIVFKYIGRRPGASPATGFKKIHEKQQAGIVNEAFQL